MELMEGKKKDIATELRELVMGFDAFIESDLYEYRENFTDKLEERVLDLLDVEKPKVMVYGIYNSGKSTLINALNGKVVAEMANRPTTAEITEYDRGDYYLVDSPGVDAPIEHEQVTEEYLGKCHVILFVMSTKGVFEDRDNYQRLAKLIQKDIPFIIVLNDRSVASKKDCSKEEKEQKKLEHEQELKTIQNKVIDNLVKESNDKNIADKYETIVVNAKKALIGLEKENSKIYDSSNISFLEKRITQFLQNDTAILALFKQPIANLKECFNEVDSIITQTISGNKSEDFSMRIHIFASKKDNVMQELQILAKQTVNSHLEEVTNAYFVGDADTFESTANTIYMEIEERYEAKLNELFVYVKQNFKELNLNSKIESNLEFEDNNIHTNLAFTETEMNDTFYSEESVAPEKKGLFDFLKSRRKREKEKQERLEREARIKNEQAQYRVQEQIRKKQEARQYASSDLDELYRQINKTMISGMNEKYNELLSQIQSADSLNRETLEKGQQQMKQLNEFRTKLIQIENMLA